MNKAKLRVRLEELADRVEEIATIYAQDAERIRQVAKRIRHIPIWKSRSDLGSISFLDGYYSRNLPEELLGLTKAFNEVMRVDMRKNMNLMSNSTFNRNNYP